MRVKRPRVENLVPMLSRVLEAILLRRTPKSVSQIELGSSQSEGIRIVETVVRANRSDLEVMFPKYQLESNSEWFVVH